MATNLKRFTISVTPNLEIELDSAKQRRYYRNTQNDMIRDLIIRGLATLKDEGGAEKQCEKVFESVPSNK